MSIPKRSEHKRDLPPLLMEGLAASSSSLPQLMPDIITARQHRPASRNGSSTQAPALDPLDETSIIEARHPEMARAITLLWGYPEMNEYFDRIWVDDGFHTPIDPEAMSELMLLARLHVAILPQRPGRNLASILGSGRLHQQPWDAASDPWGDVPPRR